MTPFKTTPIKLSNITLVKISSVQTRADISGLYPDYKNITIDNIIVQLTDVCPSESVKSIPIGYSYVPSTGILTVTAGGNAYLFGHGNGTADIYILD